MATALPTKATPNPPTRSPPTGISILVVGAGPGGLLAALESWRKGHEVRIVERSPGLVMTGDVFTIGPSVTRNWCYNWPELDDQLASIQYDCGLSYIKWTGEHIFGPKPHEFNTPEALKELDGHFVAFIQSRPKFYKMLCDQVQKIGVKIEFGKKVVRYFEDVDKKKGGVEFEDGEREEADVVVAADGVGSCSWTAIGEGRVEPKSSGFAIYRSAYPVELALANPLVRDRYENRPDKTKPLFEFWIGPMMRGTLFLSDDLACWSLAHPDIHKAKEDWSKSLSASDVIAELGEALDTWNPVFKAFIETTPEGGVIDWPLLWRDPHPTWTSPTGHVVQIGDSAHSFLPDSGNGATQAMEDSISLAACLQIGGKSNVGLATKIHSKLRFERVSQAQKMGFVNRQALMATDWDAVNKDASSVGARLGRWVWIHDPEKYAYEKYSEAFNALVNGAKFESTNIPPGSEYKPWTVDELLVVSERGERLVLEGDWS